MAEVRPIDANALMEQLRRKLKSGKTSAYLSNREQGWDEAIKSVMSMVHNQHSTLDYELVRHGKWELWEDDSEAEAWLQCSECGRKVALDYDEGYAGYNVPALTKHYPYCHCGAKMDGGAAQ